MEESKKEEMVKRTDDVSNLDYLASVIDTVQSGNLMNSETVMIPADLIKLHERNPYKAENERIGCDDLLDVFPIVGLISALGVMGPMDDGSYWILDGNRRFTAINKMGDSFWETPRADPNKRLPCHVLGDKNMPEVIQQAIMIFGNTEVRDSNNNLVYRQRVVKMLIDAAGSNDSEIRKIAAKAAKILKISPRYARMYIAVARKGIEDVGGLVSNSIISIKQANKITVLDDETQSIIVNRIKEIDSSLPKSERMSQIDNIIYEYNQSGRSEMSGRERSTAEDLDERKTIRDLDERKAIRDLGDIPESITEAYPIDEPEPDYFEMEVPAGVGIGTGYDELASTLPVEPEYGPDDDMGYSDSPLIGFGDNFSSEMILNVVGDNIPAESGTQEHKGASSHNGNMSPVNSDNAGKNYEMLQRDKLAKQVIAWCNDMMNCSSPTDAELSAIDACKRIASKF